MSEFDPNPELAQKMYDMRRNLRESIVFHPLVVTQEKCNLPPLSEYHRVFDTVVEFDAALEQWIKIGLIVTDVTYTETATALKKAVK